MIKFNARCYSEPIFLDLIVSNRRRLILVYRTGRMPSMYYRLQVLLCAASSQLWEELATVSIPLIIEIKLNFLVLYDYYRNNNFQTG